MNEFFFGVYPYVCLTIMTLGLIARYVATPGEWNARSSNLFAKKSLVVGSYIFHYTIIFVFCGHVIGLLIPSSVLSSFGFTPGVHEAIASFFGKIFAVLLLFGLCVLLFRRLTNKNVYASAVPMDIVVLLFIMFQAISGGVQDFWPQGDAMAIVGPWIRGVLIWQPRPELMNAAPEIIQCHVISAFAIFAMIPFSRLVHFFSIPLTWFARPLISYRRRYENL